MIYPKFPQRYLATIVVCLILTLGSLGATFLIYLFNEGNSPLLFSASGGGVSVGGSIGSDIGSSRDDSLSGFNELYTPAAAVAVVSSSAVEQQQQLQRQQQKQQRRVMHQGISVLNAGGVSNSFDDKPSYNINPELGVDMQSKLDTDAGDDNERDDDGGDDDDDDIDGELDELNGGQQRQWERHRQRQRQHQRQERKQQQKQYLLDDGTLLDIAAFLDNNNSNGNEDNKDNQNKSSRKHDKNTNNNFVIDSDLRLSADLDDTELELDDDDDDDDDDGNDSDGNNTDAGDNVAKITGITGSNMRTHINVDNSELDMDMDMDMDGIDDMSISAEIYQQPESKRVQAFHQSQRRHMSDANGETIYIDDFERTQPTRSNNILAAAAAKKQFVSMEIKDINYFDTIIDDGDADSDGDTSKRHRHNSDATAMPTVASAAIAAAVRRIIANNGNGNDNNNIKANVHENTGMTPKGAQDLPEKKQQKQQQRKQHKNNSNDSSINNNSNKKTLQRNGDLQSKQRQQPKKLRQQSLRLGVNKHNSVAGRKQFKQSPEHTFFQPTAASPMSAVMAVNLDALYDNSNGYAYSSGGFKQRGSASASHSRNHNNDDNDDDDGDDDNADDGFFSAGSGSGNAAIDIDIDFGNGYDDYQRSGQKYEHMEDDLDDIETADFVKHVSFKMLHGGDGEVNNSNKSPTSMRTNRKEKYIASTWGKAQQRQFKKSKKQQQQQHRKSRKQLATGDKFQKLMRFRNAEKERDGRSSSNNNNNAKSDRNYNRSATIDAIDFYNLSSEFNTKLSAPQLYQDEKFLGRMQLQQQQQQQQQQRDREQFAVKPTTTTTTTAATNTTVAITTKIKGVGTSAAATQIAVARTTTTPRHNNNSLLVNTNNLRARTATINASGTISSPTTTDTASASAAAIAVVPTKDALQRFNADDNRNDNDKLSEQSHLLQPFAINIVSADVLPTAGTSNIFVKGVSPEPSLRIGNGNGTGSGNNSAAWLETRTRRIIGNVKKSEERSRQLLLCEEAGGGELCRMLFKGHLNE